MERAQCGIFEKHRNMKNEKIINMFALQQPVPYNVMVHFLPIC